MKRIHWLLLLLGMVVLMAVVSRENRWGGTAGGIGRSATVVADVPVASKPYIYDASEQQIGAVVGRANAARVVAVLESMKGGRIDWSIIRKTADIDDRALADLRNAFSLDPPAPVDAENNAARYSYDTTSEWIISPQVVDTSTILTKSNVAYTTIRRSWTEGNACIEIRYPSFGNPALDRTLENKVMAEVERFRGMVHE